MSRRMSRRQLCGTLVGGGLALASLAHPRPASAAPSPAELVERINRYRREAGLATWELRPDGALMDAAAWFAETHPFRADLHEDRLGRRHDARLRAYGVRWGSEILYWTTNDGPAGLDEAFAWWRTSAPHREQLHREDLGRVGAAAFRHVVAADGQPLDQPRTMYVYDLAPD